MAVKEKNKKNIKSWFDGDMLLSPLLQRHLGLFLLVFVLIVVYIANRYAFQREQVYIKELREELNDRKYEALARSSGSGEFHHRKRGDKANQHRTIHPARLHRWNALVCRRYPCNQNQGSYCHRD